MSLNSTDRGTLLAVGALADGVAGSSGRRRSLRSVPEAEKLAAASELHSRALAREALLISGWLAFPSQRQGRDWPYQPLLAERISRANAPDWITGDEARTHYSLRAETGAVAWLRARHADTAFILSASAARLSHAQQLIASSLEAFHAFRSAGQEDAATVTLLRALEVALPLRDANAIAELRRAATDWVNTTLLAVGTGPAALVYEIARLDRKRQLLAYGDIAEALEVSAIAKAHGPRLGISSPFAVAYGISRLDRSPAGIARTLRVGRQHVEAMRDAARIFMGPEESRVPTNALIWLDKAWVVACELTDAELQEAVRRDRQDLAPMMDSGLREVQFEVPMTPAEQAEIRHLRKCILTAGDEWAEVATRALLRWLPASETASSPADIDLSSFVTRVVQDGGRPAVSAGDDPRHATFSELHVVLTACYWPHVLGPAISDLDAADHIGLPSLLAPFVGSVAADLECILESAARQLVAGDIVAATQGWTLLIEPLLRAAIADLGGTTTRVARDGSGDREATLDSAIEDFVALRSRDDPQTAARLSILLSGVFSERCFGWNWRNLVAHGLMRDWSPLTAWLPYLTCVALVMASRRAEGISTQAHARTPDRTAP